MSHGLAQQENCAMLGKFYESQVTLTLQRYHRFLLGIPQADKCL